jgi:hypothetical protein
MSKMFSRFFKGRAPEPLLPAGGGMETLLSPVVAPVAPPVAPAVAPEIALAPEPAPPVAINGWVEGFAAPGIFSGWAAVDDPGIPNEDVRVLVYLKGELVGEGTRSISRAELAHYGQPVGFTVTAKSEITYRDVTEGTAVLECVCGTSRMRLPLTHRLQPVCRFLAAVEDLLPFGDMSAEEREALTRQVEIATRGDPALREISLGTMEVLQASGASFDPATAPPLTTHPAQEAREVMLAFESLGLNCELGIAQRHFDAEPISLFRFANIKLAGLMAGLRSGFVGLGAPEFTEFGPFDPSDYSVRDQRYGYKSHTHLRSDQITSYEKEYARQCARLGYLRRMFFETLETGQKILVRWHSDGESNTQMIGLHNALCRHGPNRLLVVRADRSRAGKVEPLRPGLAIGYIPAFADWGRVATETDSDSWLALCRAALAHFAAERERG